MKSTLKTAPLSALVASPLNVRKKHHSAAKIAEVAASILSNGLLQPIVVHALAKPKGKLGALAGEGRLKAIQLLKQQGAAFDFDAIAVNLLAGTDAELKEASLVENYMRQDMNPAEIYSAYREMKELNPALTEADIAERFGLEPARVARIMRLAFLHPTVFDAYAAGELKDEQAFAYAGTPDQKLQLQTYERLKGKPEYQRHPRDIRAAMQIGDGKHVAMLKFVGLDAYEAAGGVFVPDLFAQEANSGRVTHEDILLALVNDKLDAFRKAVIAEHGARGEISFVEAPPKDQYGSSYDFRVRPTRTAPSAEQTARLGEIRERKQAIAAELESHPEWFDDDDEALPDFLEQVVARHDEIDALDDEADAIGRSLEILPEGPKLATITLDAGGVPQVEFYREKKLRPQAAPSRGPKPELAEKAVFALKQMRANMFGRHLFETYPDAANTRAMAHDALIFSLAWALGHNISDYYYEDKSGLGLTPGFAGSSYSNYASNDGTVPIFAPDLGDIPGLAAKDSIDGFADYHHRATPEQKDRLAAYVYFRKVAGELYKPGRRSIPEYIGTALSHPDMARRAWTPDETFFGLFKKDRILDWFGAIHKQFRLDQSKAKASELKERAALFFVASDEAVTRFGINTSAGAVRAWLPEWLRWNGNVKISAPGPVAPAPAPDTLPEGADPDQLDDGEGLGEFEEAAE